MTTLFSLVQTAPSSTALFLLLLGISVGGASIALIVGAYALRDYLNERNNITRRRSFRRMARL